MSKTFCLRISTVLAVVMVAGAMVACNHLGAEKRCSPLIQNVTRLIEHETLKEGEQTRITNIAQGQDSTVNLVRTTGVLKAHYHVEHEEIVYVISGGGVMTLAGQEKAVRPGDVIYIPRKAVHSFINGDKGETAVLSVISPAFDGKDRVYVE